MRKYEPFTGKNCRRFANCGMMNSVDDDIHYKDMKCDISNLHKAMQQC